MITVVLLFWNVKMLSRIRWAVSNCRSRWYWAMIIARSCLSATFSCQVHCGGNLEPSKKESSVGILNPQYRVLVQILSDFCTPFVRIACVDLVWMTLPADYWLGALFSRDSYLWGVPLRATRGEEVMDDCCLLEIGMPLWRRWRKRVQ